MNRIPCNLEPSEGLRPANRRRTAVALHEAALRLALADSSECTVAEITRAANVSPRTFFNYFATKDDAILGLRDVRVPEPSEACSFVRAVFDTGMSVETGARWIHATIASAFVVPTNVEELTAAVRADSLLARRITILFDDAEAACATALRVVSTPDEFNRADAHLAVAATGLRRALARVFNDSSCVPSAPGSFDACVDYVRSFAAVVPEPVGSSAD